jgi:uncharacterized membrane protein YgcG
MDAICHPAVQVQQQAPPSQQQQAPSSEPQQAPPAQPQGAPPPWVLTLCQLQQLDVASAVSLSPATAAWLLLTCGRLRRLDMSDCKTLAAGGACHLCRESASPTWVFCGHLCIASTSSPGCLQGLGLGSLRFSPGSSTTLTYLKLLALATPVLLHEVESACSPTVATGPAQVHPGGRLLLPMEADAMLCCSTAVLLPVPGGVDQLQQLLQGAAAPNHPQDSSSSGGTGGSRGSSGGTGGGSSGSSSGTGGSTIGSSSGGGGRGASAPAIAPTGPPCLPCLCHLSVGWGFSTTTLAWLLQSSPHLTRLEVCQGASVDDSLLQLLAAACPHLRHLRLSLAAVTSRGEW